MRSAGPSWPAAHRPPLLGFEAASRPLASAAFVARPRLVLAQPDFEEQQQHDTAEPGQDEGDGEHLAGQPVDQAGAQHAGDHRRGG